jgi:hypothetical protein
MTETKQSAEMSHIKNADTLVQGVTTTTDTDCGSGAAHVTRVIRKECLSPELQEPVSIHLAGKANEEDSKDTKAKQGDDIVGQACRVNKDGEDAEPSPQAVTVQKPIEPKKVETPQTDKYTSAGQSGLYDRAIEDEVD